MLSQLIAGACIALTLNVKDYRRCFSSHMFCTQYAEGTDKEKLRKCIEADRRVTRGEYSER